MRLREAERADIATFAPVFRAIVAAGETYAYPEHLDDDGIAALWMPATARCVMAVDDKGTLLGSATMGPNRPGRGSHVATASFMVDPAAQGRGVGRALGTELVRWAGEQGFAAIQFNAVVETNTAAVALWQSLGFEIIGTVPGAFDHARLGRVGLHVMHLPL